MKHSAVNRPTRPLGQPGGLRIFFFSKLLDLVLHLVNLGGHSAMEPISGSIARAAPRGPPAQLVETGGGTGGQTRPLALDDPRQWLISSVRALTRAWRA